MALHKNLAIGDIHVPYQWTYANASLRTGATGFVTSDVGKLAKQLDDSSLWQLTAITPTWRVVDAGLHASTHKNGGGDEVATATAAANAIPKADGTGKLDTGWIPAQTDSDAIHKSTANEISTITEKATLVSADLILIEDSAASGIKKKVQVGNLPMVTPPYKQSVFGDLAVDTTSTTTVWANLLSISITTVAGFLLVHASATISNSNSSKEMFLRLVIDGTAKRAAASQTSALDKAESFALVWREAVSAGAHTVKLQWKTEANTIQCRPVTHADQEHCSLLVEEVAA